MKLYTNENIIIMIPFLTIGPRESTGLLILTYVSVLRVLVAYQIQQR